MYVKSAAFCRPPSERNDDMEKGKIVEEGSHATLLRKKGAYYNFYKMQSAGFLLPDGRED